MSLREYRHELIENSQRLPQEDKGWHNMITDATRCLDSLLKGLVNGNIS